MKEHTEALIVMGIDSSTSLPELPFIKPAGEFDECVGSRVVYAQEPYQAFPIEATRILPCIAARNLGPSEVNY